MADTLAAFGGAMLTNATAYGQAQRTASQLKDAVVARSVVDQAKGILMHALGCDAEGALRRLGPNPSAATSRSPRWPPRSWPPTRPATTESPRKTAPRR